MDTTAQMTAAVTRNIDGLINFNPQYMIIGTVPQAIHAAMRTPTIIMMIVGMMQIFPPYSRASLSSSQLFPLCHATASVTDMEASRLMCIGILIHTTEQIMEPSKNTRQKTAQPNGIA